MRWGQGWLDMHCDTAVLKNQSNSQKNGPGIHIPSRMQVN